MATQNTLAELIKKQVPAIRTAIGGSTPQEQQARAERFARIALTAIRTNPKLAQCTPESFLGALMTCAQLDLEPNTPQGLAYIIPRRNGRLGTMEATFQAGYKGLLNIIYRSGAISSFNADVVYRQEVEQGLFTYESGMHPSITHKIDLLHPEARTGMREDVVAAYACATLKGGEPVLRVLTKIDLQAAENANTMREHTVWNQHYAAMAIKTAIKRLASWMPVSKLSDAIAADDQNNTNIATAEVAQTAQINAGNAITVDTLNSTLNAIPEDLPEQRAEWIQNAPQPAVLQNPTTQEPKKRGRPAKAKQAVEPQQEVQGDDGFYDQEPVPDKNETHKKKATQAGDDPYEFECPAGYGLAHLVETCLDCDSRENCPAYKERKLALGL